MKTFTITEDQLSEIAGRLEQITRGGIGLNGSMQAAAIVTLLETIAKDVQADNVVNLKDAG